MMSLRLQVLTSVLVLFSFNIHAVTRTSAGNGPWTTGATWSPAGVPTCGDSLIIQVNHTVTVPAQIDLRGCGSPLILVVRGTLSFGSGNKIRLACNSKLYVFGGAQILSGGGGGNSNLIEICNTDYWNSGDGDYSGPGCMPPNTPGCGAVLPVELAFLEAGNCDEEVCLHWKTYSERNNDYFLIERSEDGYSFLPLDKVPSLAPGGWSSSAHDYTYTDESFSGKLGYYRLKQVDLDGSFSYSGIVAALAEPQEEALFQVIPNPNSGQFSVRLKGLRPLNTVRGILRDNTGATLNEKVYYPEEGAASFEVQPAAPLKPGFYHFSVFFDNHWQHLPVMIH